MKEKSAEELTQIDKNILATLLFYDLLDYPLTLLEIFKYLNHSLSDSSSKIGLQQIYSALKKSPLQNYIRFTNGFYSLADSYSNNQQPYQKRLKRQKISAQKWKKLNKILNFLRYVPFIRGIGITGSLTLNNAKSQSDLDLLIIAQEGRIWTVRALVSILLAIFGLKRQNQKTQDKICLNCFLTENSLNLKPEVKPQNIYSAQEYARLKPWLEEKKGLWQEFQKKNNWIRDYILNYPWPQNFVSQSSASFFVSISRLSKIFTETILNIFSLEEILKQRQIKRIKKTLTAISNRDAADNQIFFDDQYLIFHPHSKSLNHLNTFTQRWQILSVVDNFD